MINNVLFALSALFILITIRRGPSQVRIKILFFNFMDRLVESILYNFQVLRFESL